MNMPDTSHELGSGFISLANAKKVMVDSYERGGLDICDTIDELLHKTYDNSDIELIPVKQLFAMIYALRKKIKE